MSMCCILTISLRDSANDSTTSAGSDIDSESKDSNSPKPVRGTNKQLLKI